MRNRLITFCSALFCSILLSLLLPTAPQQEHSAAEQRGSQSELMQQEVHFPSRDELGMDHLLATTQASTVTPPTTMRLSTHPSSVIRPATAMAHIWNFRELAPVPSRKYAVTVFLHLISRLRL